MLPVIAHNLLQSIRLLGSCCDALADQCIADFAVNLANISANVARNPILVTALSREIGYTRAAEIAKCAYRENRAVIDVAVDMTDLSRAYLEQLLDPKQLI